MRLDMPTKLATTDRFGPLVIHRDTVHLPSVPEIRGKGTYLSTQNRSVAVHAGRLV